jgi:hypothetical protein
MKIKTLVISLVIIIVIGFSGYFILSHRDITKNMMTQIYNTQTNISDKENTKSNSVLPLTNSDYVIMDDKNYIELNGKYEEIKTDNKITETITPNENHAYYAYVYEDFKILSGGDIIAAIDLTTSVFQTSRGVKLGDEISEVVEKYGKSYMDKAEYDEEYEIPGYYEYYYYDSKNTISKYITFFFDKNNKIIGIRLEIL